MDGVSSEEWNGDKDGEKWHLKLYLSTLRRDDVSNEAEVGEPLEWRERAAEVNRVENSPTRPPISDQGAP